MTAQISSFDLNIIQSDNKSDLQAGLRQMPEVLNTTRTRVLVGGCFDVLHFGHIKFLQAAKALGDYLIVALEPDEKIIKTKNRRSIHTQQQRAEILAHLRSVDEIILLPQMKMYEDYLLLVQALKPNYLAVTAGDPQLNQKQMQAASIGSELVIVTHHISSFSSSHLIKEKNWL